VANSRADATGYFAGWSSSWLASYEAHCAIQLKQFQLATSLLETLLEKSNPAPYQRVSLLRDLAAVYVNRNEIQQSCDMLRQAVRLSSDLEFTEQLQKAEQTRRAFPASWNEEPEVRELDELIRVTSHGVFLS
jgi:hypothetical protein